MRIMHIITRLILGGAQQNTVLSAAGQVRRGHEVHLAFGPIYGPEGSLRNEASRSGAKLHEVVSMRRAVLPLHDVACYFALRRVIRRIRPEVVHTHSSKAGILGRLAAWHERVPTVLHTIHGLPFHPGQPRPLHRAFVHAERLAAKHCHALIGITRAMVDAFDAEGIGRGLPFEVIPSGVDASQFRPVADREAVRKRVRRDFGIAPEAEIIGIVARLDPLKGQDDLLEIMPVLIRRNPRVHLLMVGDGWHRTALERRIHALGMAGRVTITGLVPLSQVPELLGAMDVMALPSYQEGQGRTLVEAQLCGVPVVGYAVGGIGEVCIDRTTGLLAPPGNHRALADAIGQLLTNRELATHLAAAGRAHAIEHFTIEVMLSKLERLYERLVATQSSRC